MVLGHVVGLEQHSSIVIAIRTKFICKICIVCPAKVVQS